VGLFDKSIKNKNINNVGKSVGRVCQNTTQNQKEKKKIKGEKHLNLLNNTKNIQRKPETKIKNRPN
jgi:hypothetical protein